MVFSKDRLRWPAGVNTAGFVAADLHCDCLSSERLPPSAIARPADAHRIVAARPNQFIVFRPDEQLVGADQQAKGEPGPPIQNPPADEIHVHKSEEPR